jgi:peroxiredoxin
MKTLNYTILCFSLYYLIFFNITCKNEIKFPASELQFNQKGTKININNGEYIVLIFSLNDCVICVDNIISILNESYEANKKNIEIIAIINTKYYQAVKKVKSNYGINFTILQDSTFSTKRLFSKSSYLIQKPILIYLRNGNIIKMGLVGEPRDQYKIREILTYLK